MIVNSFRNTETRYHVSNKCRVLARVYFIIRIILIMIHVSKLLFLWSCVSFGNCAKILGFFTSPSPSHHATFQTISRELASRGHRVTMISPNILNDTSVRNLREIDVHHVYDTLQWIKPYEFLSKDAAQISRFFGYSLMMRNAIEDALTNREFQAVMNRNNETFDLLIVQAMNPLAFAVASRFNVPFIGELLGSILGQIMI